MRNLLRRHSEWWLVALLGGLGLVSVIGSAWQAHLTDDQWFDGLWSEVAKAGVQVFAVGVLGGALTAVWRNITARREAKADEEAKRRDRDVERNDKIRAELVSLVTLYNGVKSVRRILRSLGLDLKTYPDAERTTAVQSAALTEEQAEGFHAQMLILNELQLAFESKARQFGQTDLLGDDTQRVVKSLRLIENHLNRVLEPWEERGWSIRRGTPLRLVSEGLMPIFRVGEHFGPQVSEPLREITRLINKHVFGEATQRTQNALAERATHH